MTYRVVHRTHYEYESDVSASYGEAHLHPRETQSQQTYSATLTVADGKGGTSIAATLASISEDSTTNPSPIARPGGPYAARAGPAEQTTTSPLCFSLRRRASSSA